MDFDRRWAEVEPLLDEPLAQRALNVGMRSYLADNHRRSKWDPEQGPWTYTSGDYWANRSLRLAEESPEWAAYLEAHGPYGEEQDLTAEEEEEWWQAFDEISEQFDPRPRTANWYRCYGACHWLAGWNCAIGQLLIPERDWFVVQAEDHSNAIGLGPADSVFVGILWGHDQPLYKAWRAVRDGYCVRLEDEIAFRRSPRRGYRNRMPFRALLVERERHYEPSITIRSSVAGPSSESTEAVLSPAAKARSSANKAGVAKMTRHNLQTTEQFLLGLEDWGE